MAGQGGGSGAARPHHGQGGNRTYGPGGLGGTGKSHGRKEEGVTASPVALGGLFQGTALLEGLGYILSSSIVV